MSNTANANANELRQARGSRLLLLVISWVWVEVPLLWGVWQTLRTSLALFR